MDAAAARVRRCIGVGGRSAGGGAHGRPDVKDTREALLSMDCQSVRRISTVAGTRPLMAVSSECAGVRRVTYVP